MISGIIPYELCELENLRSLSIPNNMLTGQIPFNLKNLTNLETLRLERNQLSGKIPPKLCELSIEWDKTGKFNISNNKLCNPTSCIVDYIGYQESENCDFTSLWGTWYDDSITELDLSENNLIGSIPSEIGNLNNLTKLELSNNQLTGAIPYEIGNLVNLTVLNLLNNNLTGEIPEIICDLNISWGSWEFNISNNQLCPPYPSCVEDNVGVQDITNCD